MRPLSGQVTIHLVQPKSTGVISLYLRTFVFHYNQLSIEIGRENIPCIYLDVFSFIDLLDWSGNQAVKVCWTIIQKVCLIT